MTNQFYIPLFAVLLFFSCKTASKAYEEGDYTQAVEKAVKKLQKNPEDAALQTVLKKSYQYAVNEHEEAIRNLSASSSDAKWERIWVEYTALQNLYETVRQYPAVSAMVNAVDYTQYVQTYGDKAAETYVEKGRNWMQEENKASYREAYNEFKKAQRFKPDDVEISKMLKEAYNLAVVKVLVVPLERYPGAYHYSSNTYSFRNFLNNIIRSLNNRNNNSFVQYYTEWELNREEAAPDEVVEIYLSGMRIGQPFDEVHTRKVSKEVVVKETVYKKDSVVREYAKVHATISTTKRTLVSDAGLLVTARDRDGRTLWADNIVGDHRWQVTFTTFTGDERALSAGDKEQLKKETYCEAPRPDEIAASLLREIENKLVRRLNNYYQRYS